MNRYRDQRAAEREREGQLSRHMKAQLWYAIQNFLIAAGNLSKFLWATKAGANAETWTRRSEDRRQLRASLEVADNSVLKLSPTFRNHFEHMDERIEQWAETSRMMVSDLIGSPNTIGGFQTGDFFRSYDPANHTWAFRGEVFEIVPVVEAMDRLLAIAEREAEKSHHPKPPDPPASEPASTGGGGQERCSPGCGQVGR